MYRDHTPDDILPVPVCESTNYNYFIREGLQFDHWDEDAYEEALFRAAISQEPWFSVRFTDKESYDAAMTALFEDSQVMGMLVRCGILDADGRKHVSYTQNELFYEISVQLS